MCINEEKKTEKSKLITEGIEGHTVENLNATNDNVRNVRFDAVFYIKRSITNCELMETPLRHVQFVIANG